MDEIVAVGVEGIAMELTSADASRSLPEFIFDCVSAALADAGCTMQDVDSVTIASEDLIDGRSLSSMITGPAAGAYLRDEIRVSEDGLVALSLGAAQIQSADCRRVLVAAWGRASEGDPERASAHGFDPFTAQPLGLRAMTISALRASGYRLRYGQQSEERDRARLTRAARAARNPRTIVAGARAPSPPFPLTRDDIRVECDAVAAVVLGTRAGVARIIGVGHATDSFHLGDRSITDLPSAGEAVGLALAEAGRRIDEVDVIELGARSLWDEVQMVESAGLAERGRGLTALHSDDRINPSGGTAAGDCEPATGLIRFVEAVQQISGRAGAHQVQGHPRLGLVCAGSALAGQTHTAVVVES